MEWRKLTNFSHDSANDQLLLAGGPDGSPELGIVPSIDLTLATDKSSVGVHLHDLLEHEAVRTPVRGGSQDGWQVEDISKSGMAQDVVAEVVGAEVTDDLRETNLVINDQQRLLYIS